VKSIYEWFASTENASNFHGSALIFWLVASVPIAVFLANSVPFIVFISVYAVVISHWSSWQAVRTERKQEKADDELRELVLRVRNIDQDHN
jgi:hypothetical protein